MTLDELNLERLLHKLFLDEENFALEDIVIFNRSIRKSASASCCCTYAYTSYGR